MSKIFAHKQNRNRTEIRTENSEPRFLENGQKSILFLLQKNQAKNLTDFFSSVQNYTVHTKNNPYNYNPTNSCAITN